MTGLILRSPDRLPVASPPAATGRPGLARLCRHLVVALIALVTIGGATRVMEAGLACPDWPLCFGALLPAGQMSLRVFLEWFHRLDAALVSAGLLLLGARSWWTRRRGPAWLPWAARWMTRSNLPSANNCAMPGRSATSILTNLKLALGVSRSSRRCLSVTS